MEKKNRKSLNLQRRYSLQAEGGGFEPGTAGIQVQRPTIRPRLPPHKGLSLENLCLASH